MWLWSNEEILQSKQGLGLAVHPGQHPAHGRAGFGARSRRCLCCTPNSNAKYRQLLQAHCSALGSCPNIPSSLCKYLDSKYKYLNINMLLVRATENISSIKVNVKRIHTRSKGHEIENNHMPSSRGPFVRVAFASAALSSAQPSQ